MREWQEDRYGRPMYPSTCDRVWRFGRGLEEMGFRQARTKPWLFVRQTPHGPVFANLGSTSIVPIWEDPTPMIHHQLRAPRWLIRKVLRQFQDEFDAHEVPYRYSFYQTSEPGGLWFPVSDEEPLDAADDSSGPDGYCHRCGAELLVGTLFCEDCERAADEELRVECEACRDRFELRDIVVHHVSYSPERTVTVCRSCHLRIHRSKVYPHLKPVDAPPIRNVEERN